MEKRNLQLVKAKAKGKGQLLTTEKAVLDCVDKIKEKLKTVGTALGELRVLLLDLYDNEAWKILGYKSWNQFVVNEFKQSRGQICRQLAAARIETNICCTVQQVGDPGSPIGEIPERTLRPLKQLPPESQRKAWLRAKRLASGKRVTSTHVNRAVDREEDISRLKRIRNLRESLRTDTTISFRMIRRLDDVLSGIEWEIKNNWRETSKKELTRRLKVLVDTVQREIDKEGNDV